MKEEQKETEKKFKGNEGRQTTKNSPLIPQCNVKFYKDLGNDQLESVVRGQDPLLYLTNTRHHGDIVCLKNGAMFHRYLGALLLNASVASIPINHPFPH